jgi:hypothetical protein
LSGGLEYLGVAGGRGWAIHVKGLGDKKEEEAVKPLLNSNCANGKDLYFQDLSRSFLGSVLIGLYVSILLM